MATWNYNRIGINGRLYSYYGTGQKWTYFERGRKHLLEIEYIFSQPNGVQYYWYSVDGKFNGKQVSAARLHYLLNQKQAQEESPGVPQPLVLQIDEVKFYMNTINPNCRPDCPECGGTGIDDDGKICRCAQRLTYEIKQFNAEKRLADMRLNRI